jgi:hypothetical protein
VGLGCGVPVGGTGVTVGGAVLVGDMAVSVGGGVLVGGTAVSVGRGVPVGAKVAGIVCVGGGVPMVQPANNIPANNKPIQTLMFIL